jgi:anti-anti-sigma factor
MTHLERKIIPARKKTVRLEIQEREIEGITILDLNGQLVLGPENLSIRERIFWLLSQGIAGIILNLKSISVIDMAGLGTLAVCAEAFRVSGGKLVLANFDPTQMSAPHILDLEVALDVFTAEQEAVNSFFPERVAREARKL